MQGAQHPWVLNTQCRVRRRLNLAVPEGRARLGYVVIMVMTMMAMNDVNDEYDDDCDDD